MSDSTFLILGCGSIGMRHLTNLRTLGEERLVAYDPSPERRREAREKPGVDVVEQIEDGWNADPDVVLITSPTSAHMSFAAEAASRGKHFFVEKPLADSLDHLPHLIETVDRGGLVSLVGCNMRFHPGVRALKRLVDEGTLGRVLSARFEVGQYLPDWRPASDYRKAYSARRELGGGVILDAIHELDYARWLLGEVNEVACFADHISALEIDTEDVASILLRFESGALAETHLDYVQRTYSRGAKLIGELGTATWDYGDPQLDLFTVDGGATRIPLFDTWEPNEMYLDELRHFLRCLAGDESPLSDVADGARSLAVALAAKTSAEEKRIVTP